MGKAVLVLPKLPENCEVCDFIIREDGKRICGVPGFEGSVETDQSRRPEGCPLRPAPSKMKLDPSDPDNGYKMYVLEHNECLYELGLRE